MDEKYSKLKIALEGYYSLEEDEINEKLDELRTQKSQFIQESFLEKCVKELVSYVEDDGEVIYDMSDVDLCLENVGFVFYDRYDEWLGYCYYVRVTDKGKQFYEKIKSDS